MKVEKCSGMSTSTQFYCTLLTRTTSEPRSEAGAVNTTELLKKGFWAAYRYYLTLLGCFRSEGLHAFNTNNSVLATFSFLDHRWVGRMNTSLLYVWFDATSSGQTVTHF